MRKLISYTFSLLTLPYALITHNWTLATLCSIGLAATITAHILEKQATS